MRFLVPVLVALLGTSPVLAAATDWQEVAPQTRVRLISSDQLDAQGRVLAGLEIDMPQAVKTYWRVPGETGIPTMLDLTGSTGIADHRMHWPYPQIDQTGGYLDYVYYGPTVLPLELTPAGGPMVLELSVVMGICSDICVPVQASFALAIDPTMPDAGQALRLAQALSTVPVSPEPDTAIGEVLVSAEGLSIALLASDIDPATVIAASSESGLLFGAPQKSPEGDLVHLSVLGGDGGQGLVGHSIDISYMTPAGAFIVVRKIAAGST